MKQQRTGLGKKVSSIFDGTQLPIDDQASNKSDNAHMPQPSVSSLKQLNLNNGSENRPNHNAPSYRFSNNKFTGKTIRQNAAPMLVAILSVILISILVYQNFDLTASTIETPISAKASTFQPVTFNYEVPQIDWSKPKPIPVGLRDPMALAVTVAANPGSRIPDIVVSGIMFSLDDPTAVINGQIIRPGDEIIGAVITQINQESVHFQADGEQWIQGVEY